MRLRSENNEKLSVRTMRSVFSPEVLEGALGCAQSLFFIGNRNLGLRRQNFAEAFIGTLIRTCEIPPGIGEALHRCGR